MKSKRILIVDDQRYALRLIKDVLIPLGYVVDEANDGPTAYRKAVELEPSLIIMDLVMPGVDGTEACRMIKHDSRTSSIPVIIITSTREKDRLAASFEAGADDYLTRPFSSHELLARINSNLIKREPSDF